ncbi:glycosyltransferase family 4 protein [Azospira restricta]|uniref:Glycosyltransferase family 4 protein n=1 Tax=Azospira restricta TaxID=404405 RepID=A0A974PYU7_9RHOO|nr:glycosyltransferase family 4 protein [Azospira restricta]QRJ63603.1 glycosyltransferase family 4 protein [Azospira restricta]
MKILLLAALYPPNARGGAEIVAEQMARGLAGRGHEVAVLTLSPSGVEDETTVDGTRIIRIPLINLYRNLDAAGKSVWMKRLWHAVDIYNAPMGRKVEQIIRELTPDLVCSHNLPGFSVAALAAAHRMRVPLVQVLHDNYFICPLSTCYRNDQPCAKHCLDCRLARWPHRRLSASASAVVGVSAFTLDRVTRNGMFAGVPRFVIYNTRNLPFAEKTGPMVVGGPHRFGYLGALTAHKGIESLICAFRDGIATGSATLTIAGTGEPAYIAHLQRIADPAPIRFVGQMPAQDFFARIDTLVVPSLCHEALSLAAIEAGLASRPVIAARRGGLPEVVADGRNGLLYDPDIPGALSACMQRLIDDNPLYEQLANSGRNASSSFGDIEAWLSHYESVFNFVLTNRTSPKNR